MDDCQHFKHDELVLNVTLFYAESHELGYGSLYQFILLDYLLFFLTVKKFKQVELGSEKLQRC